MPVFNSRCIDACSLNVVYALRPLIMVLGMIHESFGYK